MTRRMQPAWNDDEQKLSTTEQQEATVSDHEMRVGDSERDETASQLSEHFAAGRLDHSEFAERTEKALSARTRGELNLVLNDLPVLPVAVKPSTNPAVIEEVSPAQLSERAEWRRSTLTTWAVFAVFFVILWAVTGAGYFWPVFPILGWGIGVAVSGIQAYRHPGTLPNEQDQRTSLPPFGNDPGGADPRDRDRP